MNIINFRSAAILAIVFLALQVNAQDKKFRVGVKLGAGAASLSDTCNKPVLAVNAGASLSYKIGDNIELEAIPQIGLGGGRAAESSLRLSQLQLPLNFRYNVNLNTPNLKTYIKIGGYTGYGLSAVSYAKRKMGSYYENVAGPNLYAKGLMNRFDYGFLLGTGIEYQGIAVGILISRGCANLNKSGAKSNSVFLNFTKYL